MAKPKDEVTEENLTEAELEALTAPSAAEEAPADEAAEAAEEVAVVDEDAAPPPPKSSRSMSEDELWAKARRRNPRLPEKPFPEKQDK
jgi:hypothetical protein